MGPPTANPLTHARPVQNLQIGFQLTARSLQRSEPLRQQAERPAIVLHPGAGIINLAPAQLAAAAAAAAARWRPVCAANADKWAPARQAQLNR